MSLRYQIHPLHMAFTMPSADALTESIFYFLFYHIVLYHIMNYST